MKRTASITVVLAVISSFVNGQEDWRGTMAQPNASYYDIINLIEDGQTAVFDEEEGDSTEIEGGGQNHYTRWKRWWGARMKFEASDSASGHFTDAHRAMYALSAIPAANRSSPIASCSESEPFQADWQLLGPISMPQQTMGRVDRFAVDPNDNAIVYAGTGTSGLWRTGNIEDAQPVWDNITDNLMVSGLGITKILFEPGSSDVMYIATGMLGWGNGYGFGVLKTTNASTVQPDWTYTDLSFDPADIELRTVHDIQMDPSDNQVLYALTSSDVYKTSDGGTNWETASTSSGPLGFPAFVAGNYTNYSASIFNMELDPVNSGALVVSGTLYPIVSGIGDQIRNAIWRFDGQWSEVTPELSSSPKSIVRISSYGSNIYALYRDFANIDYINVSIDGGEIWSLQVSQLTNSNNNSTFKPNINWESIFKVSSNVVYLEGENSNLNRRVYKSIDGGDNFFAVSNYYPSTLYNGVSTHADIRGILVFNPSSDGLTDGLLVGNDGGVLYSTSSTQNGNIQTVNWQNKNGIGLAITQFYGLAGTESNSNLIVAGAQDNGAYTMANNQWTYMISGFGDAYDGVFDLSSSPIAVLQGNYNYPSCSSSTAVAMPVYRRWDSGSSLNNWSGAVSSPPLPCSLPCNCIASSCQIPACAPAWHVRERPITVDNQNRLYIAHHDLWQSVNQGVTWSQISIFPNQERNISAIAVSPSDPDIIIVGYSAPCWGSCPPTVTDYFYRTTDGGQNWTDITAALVPHGIPQYGEVSSIVIASDDPDKIWLTLKGFGDNGSLAPPYNGSGRVFRSLDGGATWTDYSDGLTPMPVHCSAYEQDSNDGLYVGTEVGVFYRNSGMDQWVCYSQGLPRAVVTGLDINYGSNSIRCSTFGRGIWSSSLVCPPDANLSVSTSDVSGLSSDMQFRAQDVVNSDAVIGQLAYDVDLVAGEMVQMTPPFQISATQGKTFSAFIRSCSDPAHHSARFGDPNQPRTSKAQTSSFNLSSVDIRPALHPNPTTGLITYNGTAPLASATIMDLTGRALHTVSLNGAEGSVNIDLSPYRPGTYLLRIQYQSGKVEVHRIIRQ